jgi:hypothetical protein
LAWKIPPLQVNNKEGIETEVDYKIFQSDLASPKLLKAGWTDQLEI